MVDNLLDKKTSYAIIGASNSEEKYGYKIYKQMKSLGYKVFPINPREELILGDFAFETIDQLPSKVDVLNFVVPPEVSKKITNKALNMGYKIFWYQPGSFDKQVLDLHEGKDTVVINNKCLLIESSNQE